MGSEPPPPPLAVELSRPVMLACRRQPEAARAINSVILRASRRLRAMTDDERRLQVAGRVEGIVLDLHLIPPDRCLVEAISEGTPDRVPDLTV